MLGLVNKTLQGFLTDTYGAACWRQVAQRAGLAHAEFEAMLHYDVAITEDVVAAAETVLDKPRATVLEDAGTYLVSHPNTEALRRLLRFGGVDFIEFLHSLDDLPDRARLAVPDLHLPDLELQDHTGQEFGLLCRGPVDGFGHVLVGGLRAMADDYGTLVMLEHAGRSAAGELILITVIDTAFAEGRSFALGDSGRDSARDRRGVPT
ncbi:heme NO-binding domain-containing protein [Thalassococcus sp. BH17M4-6]|uniref:heme NO-binding domain-containing protein n=1 Tax=Thalassococcus sp. BH17M4-6 TaxID=3413148 RepID=UPI003BDA1AC0